MPRSLTRSNNYESILQSVLTDLLGDKERDALKELVCVERGDGEVEKQTIKHRTRNQFELLNEQHRQTDEHVRHY